MSLGGGQEEQARGILQKLLTIWERESGTEGVCVGGGVGGGG